MPGRMLYSARGWKSRSRVAMVVVFGAALLLLAGCSSAGTGGTVRGSTHSPMPAVTEAACLKNLPVHSVDVKGIDVQVIGESDKAVVVSNQSGQHVCGWVDLAQLLHEHGYEVALYEYSGISSDNAIDVLDYERAHGSTKVALLGSSQGAKASIVAAAEAKQPPDALIALSPAQYLEGNNVEESAAKLRSPTYYLTADNDPLSASATENFQNVTPAGLGTREVIPGTDHGVQLLKDAGVTDHVFAFLDEHLGH